MTDSLLVPVLFETWFPTVSPSLDSREQACFLSAHPALHILHGRQFSGAGSKFSSLTRSFTVISSDGVLRMRCESSRDVKYRPFRGVVD